MEKKYCGKCGNTIQDCTCSSVSQNTNNEYSSQPSPSKKSEVVFLQKPTFDGIVLCSDETPIRQYEIGAMKLFGSGSATVTVTNRRVILHSFSRYLFSKTNMLQEVPIESVTGVSTYCGQGIKPFFLIWGTIFTLTGLALRSQLSLPFVLFFLFAGITLIFISRRPTFSFVVSAAMSGSGISTAVNVRGVMLSSHGNGIVFTFNATDEALSMMRELGACIMDIKAKGDIAIKDWQNTSI